MARNENSLKCIVNKTIQILDVANRILKRLAPILNSIIIIQVMQVNRNNFCIEFVNRTCFIFKFIMYRGGSLANDTNLEQTTFE